MNIGPLKLTPLRNPQLVRVLLEFRRLIIQAFGLQIGTVANLAAFAAMTAVQMAQLDDGSHKWVRTVLRWYRLDTTSAALVDGITVVAAIGGGRWIAEPRADRKWEDQSAWYINALTGNDENAGSAVGTALKTWAEYVRRTGETRYIAGGLISVTILTNLPVTDPIRQNIRTGQGGLFRVQAARLLDAGGGPFTVLAYARNPAADNPGTLTANEIGFVPGNLIGKMVQFTSGPALGAICYIDADNGAGVAQVSTPTDVPTSDQLLPTVLVPVNGDDFQVLDLVEVYGEYIRVQCEGDDVLPGSDAPRCVLDSLKFLNGDANYPNAFAVGGERFTMRMCEVTNLLVVGDATIVQCSIGTNTQPNMFEVRHGDCGVYAGRFGIISIDPDSLMLMFDGPLAMGSMLVSGSLRIDAEGLGIYAAPSTEVSLSVGASVVTAGIVHGTGGGGPFGVSMNSSTIFKYDPALPPRVHTGANAVNIGGINRSWADVPYVEPHIGAIVTDGGATGGSPTVYQTGFVGAVTQNLTRYLAPSYTEQVADLSGFIVQNNCTIRKLRVHAGTASGAGQTYTVTIVKNGVPSTVTCQLAGAGVDANDLVHTFLANPGDRISVKADASITSLAADILVSFEAG